MKIRTGFVSNSSSCSYTCDICGYEESGMDLGLSEIEMVSCGDHYILVEEIQSKFKTYKEFKDYIKEVYL